MPTTPSTSFVERYGPWAAVTGAAQGIGAGFATELARRGLDLVLVDREADLLAAQAASCKDAGSDVRQMVVELAEPGAPERLARELARVDLGLLISNAAVVSVGPFLDHSLERSMAQLVVNCQLPLALLHEVLPRLVTRRRGGVVLVSSLSALRGAPFNACYAASKAWNLVLAESLWAEVSDAGVDVMAVLPGTTRTPGFLATRPRQSAIGSMMEPADVVREALDALGSGPFCVPGKQNRDSELFMSTLDRAEAVRMVGEVTRAMYGGHGSLGAG